MVIHQVPTKSSPDTSRMARRRVALVFSLIYWVLLLGVLTLLAIVDGWEMWSTFFARCVNTVLAVAMTMLIAGIVTRFENESFTRQASIVLSLTLVSAAVYFLITFYIFRAFGGNESPMELGNALRMILYWFAQFLGWSALFLTFLFSVQVKDRERQLSELREQAYGAQMRALRYQINPHFLFNTLNAVATLIEERDVGPAERMVLSLSAFLRSTLALDPMQDITLAEELDIQARYLDIERERFSDRLSVELDVPEELRRARVPSLILQPLIENAVKHGVGSLDRAVHVRIAAEADRNVLSIHIDNDAAEHAQASAGAGVGLRNVADRLATRFGGEGRLTSGRSPEGRFRATVQMPVRMTPR